MIQNGAANSQSTPGIPAKPKISADQSQADSAHYFKTKICRHFEVGRCMMGDKCNFAHGDTDLVRKRPNRDRRLTNFDPVQKIHKLPSRAQLQRIERDLQLFVSFQRSKIDELRVNTNGFSKNGNKKFDLNVRLVDFQDRRLSAVPGAVLGQLCRRFERTPKGRQG